MWYATLTGMFMGVSKSECSCETKLEVSKILK